MKTWQKVALAYFAIGAAFYIYDYSRNSNAASVATVILWPLSVYGRISGGSAPVFAHDTTQSPP
jgi:hypothetical protein